MITANETIQKYSEYNKIYIPINYVNNNYKYTISGDEVTIITNNNCRTSYNTTYCDCYRYNEKYNIMTQSYECNANPSNYIIDNNYITSDIDYSDRIVSYFRDNYIITYGIVIIVFLFTLTFKKNSRRV